MEAVLLLTNNSVGFGCWSMLGKQRQKMSTITIEIFITINFEARYWQL